MAKLVAVKALNINIGQILLIGLGLSVVLFLWWQKDKIIGAFGSGLSAINPVNPENIFNRAANNLLQTATGTDNSIGTALQATVEKAKVLLTETFTGKPWYWDETQAAKTRAALRRQLTGTPPIDFT